MWINDDKGNELISWRKANHIHKWFVDNIQNGNDDCGNGEIKNGYEVTIEKLMLLLDTINKVLGETDKEKMINHLLGAKFDIEKAEELLPTQSGFFFGGTDYDEYYVDDLIRTKEFLDNLLPKLKGKVYYHSSW